MAGVVPLVVLFTLLVAAALLGLWAWGYSNWRAGKPDQTSAEFWKWEKQTDAGDEGRTDSPDEKDR